MHINHLQSQKMRLKHISHFYVDSLYINKGQLISLVYMYLACRMTVLETRRRLLRKLQVPPLAPSRSWWREMSALGRAPSWISWTPGRGSRCSRSQSRYGGMLVGRICSMTWLVSQRDGWRPSSCSPPWRGKLFVKTFSRIIFLLGQNKVRRRQDQELQWSW